jgi:hypothetical protein
MLESGLDLVASLTRDNFHSCKMLIDRGALCIIVKCMKDRIPAIRLMACTCIANFYKTKAVGTQEIDMASTVVPTLIQLLAEEGAIKAKAPMILGIWVFI